MSASALRYPAILFLPACLLIALFATASAAQQSSVQNLLESAAGGTGLTRYTAIDELGELRQAAGLVIPQLIELLDEDDVQVRWRAARALGDYGALAQDAAPKLRRMLNEDSSVVRYHAATALGRIGISSEATIEALVNVATGQDANVARVAIAALRNLEADRAVVLATFARAIESDDQAVILHAVEALVEEGADAVPILKEALGRPETAYLACVAIHDIGPDAKETVPALAELLEKTSHSKVLIEALLALGNMGPAAKAAGPQIVPLLQPKEDVTVSAAAAFALGAIGAKEAEDELRRAAGSPDPFLGMIAVWSLAKLNPNDNELLEQAVERLVKGLASQDDVVRTTAARGLELLQPPADLVAPHLLSLSNDPDPDVVANVVSALASLGEKVVPRAKMALADPQKRKLAIRVLTQLGPQAAEAVEPLLAALKQSDAETQMEIQLALAAIGPRAAAATNALVAALASDDARVRESAIYALRDIGPGAYAAKDELLRMSQSDTFEGLAAAWALASIAADDADVASKVLPALLSGLQKSNPQLRLNSIEALTAWKSAAKRAIPALTQLAQEDTDAVVRDSAEQALLKISQSP